MAEFAGIALAALLLWTVFPMLARIVGAGLVVVGLVAATSSESWAGWTIVVGAGLWLAGSWLHTVKRSTYSSPLARLVFGHAPLKWTLWQNWRGAAGD